MYITTSAEYISTCFASLLLLNNGKKNVNLMVAAEPLKMKPEKLSKKQKLLQLKTNTLILLSIQQNTTKYWLLTVPMDQELNV